MIRVNKIICNSKFCDCMQEIAECEKERVFCGHDIEHLLSVARIMQIIAHENKMEIDKEIIYAAALLHDIGRARAYRFGTDHAEDSAEIARRILADCDFNNPEADEIVYAILHHNDSGQPNELCALLRKADKLSRNCFCCPASCRCKWSDDKKNKEVTV